MKKKNHRKDVIYLCLVLILVLVVLISGLHVLESADPSSATEATPPRKTVVRNGIEYYPRQDVTNFLFIGLDREGFAQDSNFYNNPAAADMVALLVFDHTNEVCNIICLNRDTMVEMPVLGLGGKLAGTRTAQLALSHTYGSGLKDSCRNVVKTVSDLFYGVDIDHYASLGIGGISMVNDAVGGVKVNVTDDFSRVDPTITKGECVLTGAQAETFIRSRYGVGNQLNLNRMARQKEYMGGFVTALSAKMQEDPTFMLDFYEDIDPYLVTDCTSSTLSNLLSKHADYAVGEIVIPEGTNILQDEHYEFYLDMEALDEVIMRLLYAPKK